MRAAITAFALAMVSAAHCYEVPTHIDMGRFAARASRLGSDPSLLSALGIDALARFPSSGGQNDPALLQRGCIRGDAYSIDQLIACGAGFEDVPGSRAINHFFDPTRAGSPTDGALRVPTAVSSPTWALAAVGSLPSQKNSYADARKYFYEAVTATAASERSERWGLVFQSIGQVLHHLQDMAQPQHVRDDPHCDWEPCALIPGKYSPSRFEADTLLNAGTLAALLDSPPIPPAHVARFPMPRSFWIGNGVGIAEYANKNFVSQGKHSMFRMVGGVATRSVRYPLPEPSASPASRDSVLTLLGPDVTDGVRLACNHDLANCFVDFYSSRVDDALTGESRTNARAASYSVLDQDLEGSGSEVQTIDVPTGIAYSTQKVFSVNRFNFKTAREFLIPKAISYSATFIDYFFRGKLEINFPANLTTATLRGSSEFSLAVQNRSVWGIANGTPRPELMEVRPDTVLQAVVKFNQASGTDRMLVSQPAATSDFQGINNQPQLVSFRFGNATVPLDATNIKVQVVYKGMLGAEDSAVVVATVEVPPPLPTGYVVVSDFTETTKIFKASTLEKVGEIPAVPDADSYYVSMTPNGDRVFRSEFNSEFGDITVIDMVGDPNATPPVAPFSRVSRFSTGFNWPLPTQSIVSPDGKFLFVAHAWGSTASGSERGALVSVDIRRTLEENGQAVPNPNLYKVVQTLNIDSPWYAQMSEDGTRIVLTSDGKGGADGDRLNSLPYATGRKYHVVGVEYTSSGTPTMTAQTHLLPRGPYSFQGLSLREGGRVYAPMAGVPGGYFQSSMSGMTPEGVSVPRREIDPRALVPGTNRTTFTTPDRVFAINALTGAFEGAVADSSPIPEVDIVGSCESRDGQFRYVLDWDFNLVGQRVNADGSTQEFARFAFGPNDGPSAMACSDDRRAFPPQPQVALDTTPPPAYCAISETGESGAFLGVLKLDATRPHYAAEMPRRYKVRVKRYATGYPPYANCCTSGFPILVFELWNERKDYFQLGAPYGRALGTFDFHEHIQTLQVGCTPGATVRFDWEGSVLNENWTTEYPARVQGTFDAWRAGDDPLTRHRVVFTMTEDVWYEIVFSNDTDLPSVREFIVQPDSGLPPTYR